MKIHALCIAKNEIDIIEQTLIHAINWCDFIYFFDNGSSDGTWEKVLDLSRKHKQIIPFKQEACPFSDSLRSQIFNHYRENCAEGDWWCRLDADEIYIDNPKDFLSQISQKYQVVVTATLHYYMTEKDLELYEKNPSLYDDKVPVEEKCRYYLNNWSEIRLFRYKKDLVWSDEFEWPSGLSGDAYPTRIRLKNFQYRSPKQIEKRLKTRQYLISEGLFPHESQTDWKSMLFDVASAPYRVIDGERKQSWKDRVVESVNLDYDAHDGQYILRSYLMPNLFIMSLIWDYRLTPRNLIKRLLKKILNEYRNLIRMLSFKPFAFIKNFKSSRKGNLCR